VRPGPPQAGQIAHSTHGGGKSGRSTAGGRETAAGCQRRLWSTSFAPPVSAWHARELVALPAVAVSGGLSTAAGRAFGAHLRVSIAAGRLPKLKRCRCTLSQLFHTRTLAPACAFIDLVKSRPHRSPAPAEWLLLLQTIAHLPSGVAPAGPAAARRPPPQRRRGCRSCDRSRTASPAGGGAATLSQTAAYGCAAGPPARAVPLRARARAQRSASRGPRSEPCPPPEPRGAGYETDG
jgi:hypothetical protein